MPDIYDIYSNIRHISLLYDLSPLLAKHALRLNLELPA